MEGREKAKIRIKYGAYCDYIKARTKNQPMAIYVKDNTLISIPVSFAVSGNRYNISDSLYMRYEKYYEDGLKDKRNKILDKLGQYQPNYAHIPFNYRVDASQALLEDIATYIAESGEWPRIGQEAA